MEYKLRPMEEADIPAILDLSIRAWEPVFQSFEQVLGRAIFLLEYPDWRPMQRKAVEDVLRDTGKFTTLVAEVEGAPIGFLSYMVDEMKQTGEVWMLAVDPANQNHGIGTALNLLALDQMRGKGVRLVAVGTGGDPGHAPARRSYEKAGYTALPLVRYYKALTEEG